MGRCGGRLLSVAALTFATVPALGQDATLPAYRHRIVGIYDMVSGLPIEGVSVTDLKSGTSALTTKTGTVSLVYLPEGGGLVRVRKVGYEPVTQFVPISPKDTAAVTMLLAPAMTTLPALVRTDSASRYTSPGLREFEMRRTAGHGHFITEAELRKQDNRGMQDLIRKLPGVQVSCSSVFPSSCYAVSGRIASRYAIMGGGRCVHSIYVDGVLTNETDLNRFPVRDFAAVESYVGPAQIPVRYNATGNACGVLLFWSRER